MFEEHNNNKTDISAKPDPLERRRHARYPFTATVEVLEYESQTRIQGRVSDLSRGGCYVDAISSFPSGSVVKMRLTRDTRTLEAQAKVVYTLTGMGMGVKFLDANPEQIRNVAKWLGEPSAEQTPRSEHLSPSNPPGVHRAAGSEEYEVLNDLIVTLMKQGFLSHEMGETMLHRLNRAGIAASN